MERLTNPRNFAGRSLVLWNADYTDHGIAYRVIKQCCERFNNENPNAQVWFKRSDFNFQNEDYTQPETWHDRMVWDEKFKEYVPCCELKRCGILLNTGCYTPQHKDEWLKLINTHTNYSGGVSQDCALIVCVQADIAGGFGPINPDSILKEEQFGENCDIYHIQPTIEEWAKWAEPFYDAEIFKVVHAYIEKNGVIRSFDYWMRIMDSLDRLKELEDCPLRQIPERKVSLAIKGISIEHPASDFCKFIYEYNSID